MQKTINDVDMLHGPLGGKLVRFALPIAASSMLQQLFNAADTAVVGHYGDANALAAVGTNGEVVALLVSLSAGLAVGVNVLLASLIGSGEKKPMQAVIYLKLYFLGYPLLLVYDFGAAVLRAKGDSRRPFLILLLSGALNVLLNLFFVAVGGSGGGRGRDRHRPRQHRLCGERDLSAVL